MIKRIPSSPPIIDPIPFDHNRPLLSVMIPVYNCTEFLSDVLNSVLLQDLGVDKMQIEVIDDASTDNDVEAMVNTISKGRVGFFRQPKNVGSLRNFETCINRAKGKLIHLLHGDDRVRLGFYNKMIKLFELSPEVGAAFCRYATIDESGKYLFEIEPIEKIEGIIENALKKIASEQIIQVVSMVVKRDVYETLGSFYAVKYGEDWEMWVRIAKYYPIAYTPEVLSEYRKHLGSISWQKSEDGQNTKDLAYALKLIENHLPEGDKKLMTNAKKNCALYCMAKANVIWKQTKLKSGAMPQVNLALSLSKSTKIYYHIIKFYIKLALKVY